MFYFMDNESFDQIELSEESIAERMQFVREDETVALLMMDDGTVLDVEPPTFVTLRVVEAEVAIRGDTSSNLTKLVTVETGARVQVPAFVKIDDLLRIDTRTGEYIERAKE